MRICSKCKIEKQDNEMGVRRKLPSGEVKLCSWCKECRRLHCKDYYDKNRDKELARAKKYREEHPEELLVRNRKYVENNRDKVLLIWKNYRDSHVEERRAYRKAYSEERLAYNKEWKRNKRKTDPVFNIENSIRRRICSFIKKEYKTVHTEVLLGCSWEQLKSYLESKFQPGMSWDNHGLYGWHIDHIVPLTWFDLTNPEQLSKACHYTNLQPMWAEDNLVKNNRYVG